MSDKYTSHAEVCSYWKTNDCNCKPVESVSPPDWIAKAAKEAAEELGTMYLVNVLRVKELIQSAIERNRP
jgi:hypothetical protein